MRLVSCFGLLAIAFIRNKLKANFYIAFKRNAGFSFSSHSMVHYYYESRILKRKGSDLARNEILNGVLDPAIYFLLIANPPQNLAHFLVMHNCILYILILLCTK